MKVRDGLMPLPRSIRCAGAKHNLAARSELVDSIYHYLLALGQPLFDRYVAALGNSGRDRADVDGLVILNHVDKGSLRTSLDSHGGDDDLILLNVHQEPNVDKLVWEQHALFVVEDRLKLRRSR